MPLVLSLKQDDDFFVGSKQFRVVGVRSQNEFIVRDEQSGATFDIGDKRATEIMPDVFVSAGEKQAQQLVRATIAAPAELLVLRGDKFRNPPAKLARR
jgi:hypothetical protein